MSLFFTFLPDNSSFVPTRLLARWYDSAASSTITKAYQDIAPTGSGSITTNTITASSSVATIVPIGSVIRIGGTDTYTVSNVVTTTITTVEPLSATYSAGSALALDKVSQWDDKTRQFVNAVQGTASLQPVYIPNPALATLAGQRMTTVDMTLPGEFSIFIVNSTFTQGGTCVMLGSGTAANTCKIGRNSTNAFIRVVNGGSSDQTLVYPANNTPNILTVLRDSNNKVDGAFDRGVLSRLFSDVAQSGDPSFRWLFQADASTGQVWIGSIMEILVYSRRVSDAERVAIELYLSSKWGTP